MKKREKRVISPQGKTQDPIEALISATASAGGDVVVGGAGDWLEPPRVPPPEPGNEAPSVDEYLRRRYYAETYGTEEPTEYDRFQQALRGRL